MSYLNTGDRDLLTEIRNEIQGKAGIDHTHSLTQKDYQFLVYFIEENTNIKLSLSTIKRIWKNEYNRLPHISTLNTLAQLGYGKDWLPLKKQSLEKKKVHNIPQNQSPETSKKNLNSIWLIPIGALVLLIIFSFYQSKKTNTPAYDHVQFSARTSVQDQIPNTVVFNYDVSKVEAEEFFIQQSWDKRRKVKIDKGNNEQTDIYYEPGYFQAKLIADDVILKEIPVHIIANKWFASIKQDNIHEPLHKKQLAQRNYLGINTLSLEKTGIDLNKSYRTIYQNSRNFALDGDDFSFTTSIKMKPMQSVACPYVNIFIKGASNYIMLTAGLEGCESELSLRFSNNSYSGKTNDLTALGVNIYDWLTIKLYVQNNNTEMYIAGKPVFKSEYSASIGNIKEITYSFNGIGMIDELEFSNDQGERLYHDSFDGQY